MKRFLLITAAMAILFVVTANSNEMETYNRNVSDCEIRQFCDPIQTIDASIILLLGASMLGVYGLWTKLREK